MQQSIYYFLYRIYYGRKTCAVRFNRVTLLFMDVGSIFVKTRMNVSGGQASHGPGVIYLPNIF